MNKPEHFICRRYYQHMVLSVGTREFAPSWASPTQTLRIGCDLLRHRTGDDAKTRGSGSTAAWFLTPSGRAGWQTTRVVWSSERHWTPAQEVVLLTADSLRGRVAESGTVPQAVSQAIPIPHAEMESAFEWAFMRIPLQSGVGIDISQKES